MASATPPIMSSPVGILITYSPFDVDEGWLNSFIAFHRLWYGSISSPCTAAHARLNLDSNVSNRL